MTVALQAPREGGDTLPVRMPNMQALRTFEAVARAGSFTQAAEELYLTQSAVTYQIRNLEDYLGVKLFQRLPRGICLTTAGHAIRHDVTSGLALIGRSLSVATRAESSQREWPAAQS